MSMEGRLVPERENEKERGRGIRIGKKKENERGKEIEIENGKKEGINRICRYNNSNILNWLLRNLIDT